MHQRYAIFFTPPAGPLADFADAWLGWSSMRGQPVPHPELDNIDVAAVTETPRRYGFHGTLKPPFRLATPYKESELFADFQELADRTAPVSLSGMKVANLSGFVAVRPDETEAEREALSRLAASIVRSMDRFRAPLNSTELAKRRASPLTNKQEQYLADWGYPYVMEEFRFHMTLSGKLPERETDALLGSLAPVFEPILNLPFQIDAISLLGQTEDGYFHLLERCPLLGSSQQGCFQG